MTISIKHSKTLTVPDWTQTDLNTVIAGGAPPLPPSGTLISGVAVASDWSENLTTSMATGKLIGRSTAGTGSFEEITIGAGLSLSAGTLTNIGAGSGDVTGPASATDNAITRMDGTTGKIIQSSPVILSDNGDIAIPSTATVGLQLFNTVDQVTNVERLEALFGSNIAQIGTRTVGTASTRNLQLFCQANNGIAAYSRADLSLSSPFFRQGLYTSTTGTSLGSTGQTGAMASMGNYTGTASSGVQIGLSVSPTWNQTSTAGATDFVVNRTNTAPGAGVHNHIDTQIAGVSTARLDTAGIWYCVSVSNTTSISNSALNLTANGATITRNIADAQPCLTIDQQNASSTGNIVNFKFNGTVPASIDTVGVIRCQGIANATATNARIQMLTTGTVINRTVADANPCLTVNQNSSSATGDLLILQANGVAKLNVAYDGTVTLANTTDSSAYTNGSMILAGGLGVAKQIRTNTSIAANTSISAGTTVLAGSASAIGITSRSRWFSSSDGTFQARNAANSADADITAGTYNGNTIGAGSTSGTNTGDQLVFKTISVSGQSDVVADTTTDTLTLVAGSNVTITTNASTDTITIAASGGGGGVTYFDAGNSSTAKTIDWSNGNWQKLTLTGNCTLTFTAPAAADNLRLDLYQDGTGSRTVTWPAAVKKISGVTPTLTTTATTGRDSFMLPYNGTDYTMQAYLDIR